MSTSNQARKLRRQADSLDLMMIRRGELFILTDPAGSIAHTGPIEATEQYLAERFTSKPTGPAPFPIPEDWEPSIQLLVREMKAARRSAGTQRCRRLAITKFAWAHPHLTPSTVTRDDLVEYLGNNDWTPRYAVSVRASLRVFFAMLRDRGLRDDDPAARLPTVQVPRSVPRPCPDHAVLQAFTGSENPTVRLALRIAVETGTRRAEIAAVRRTDVEGDHGAFWLRVVGKGGHERTIPISDELAAMIVEGPGRYVFPSVDRWGNPVGEHVTPAHLGKLIAAALPDNWTAHKLRHRYATKAYQASKDVLAVQELLGHASLNTTMVYVQVANESLRSAASAAMLDGLIG